MAKQANSDIARHAFLIIDMQKGSFSDKTPRFKAYQVIENINKFSTKCRYLNVPVIFIQHDGSKNDEFFPGTEEWEILDDLHIKSGDTFISKTANDAFFNSNLEETLNQLNVDTLIISGCATEFCVESTVQSAITKNFNIIILEDAHTTADRKHLPGRNIIEHYNITWQRMIPVLSSPKVIKTKELITQINDTTS